MGRRAPASADRYGTTRLASKKSEPALVARLAAELGLPVGKAEAIYDRVALCFAEFGVTPSRDGELCYVAVDADEPKNKPISACRRVQVRLALVDAEDREALRGEGLAGMRRRRVVRLARQAEAQGALLTIEDLAYLTCSSLATVKRDLAWCRGRGESVPTRGHAGTAKGRLSRPARAAQLYLEGLTHVGIARRLRQPEAEIRGPLADFAEIAVLCSRGVGTSRIRAITNHPPAMVAEYVSLASRALADAATAPRLHELMTVHGRRAPSPPSP